MLISLILRERENNWSTKQGILYCDQWTAIEVFYVSYRVALQLSGWFTESRANFLKLCLKWLWSPTDFQMNNLCCPSAGRLNFVNSLWNGLSCQKRKVKRPSLLIILILNADLHCNKESLCMNCLRNEANWPLTSFTKLIFTCKRVSIVLMHTLLLTFYEKKRAGKINPI